MSLEELLTTSIDLDYQIFVFETFRDRNFLGNVSAHDLVIFTLFLCYHNSINLLTRLDIAELFGIALEEGCTGEQNLSVYYVVLYRNSRDIDRFNA